RPSRVSLGAVGLLPRGVTRDARRLSRARGFEAAVWLASSRMFFAFCLGWSRRPSHGTGVACPSLGGSKMLRNPQQSDGWMVPSPAPRQVVLLQLVAGLPGSPKSQGPSF
ncbi:MAG: hypothetical protein ACK56I_30390, partial [bacterium]